MKVNSRIVVQEKHFGFGHHWKKLYFSSACVAVVEADEPSKDMLRCDGLKEKRFLDVGSGRRLES